MSKDIPGFMAGMRGGWVALVDFLHVAATADGALVPLIGLGALAVRHRRRRRAAPSVQPAE